MMEHDFALYFGVMMFLIAAGWLFWFCYYTVNNFLSYFILFFICGHVLIALSFLLSVFFQLKKTALITGYFLLLGLALCCTTLVENHVGISKMSTQLLIGGLVLFLPLCCTRRGATATATRTTPGATVGVVVCVGANSRRKFSSQNFTILTLC
jgi:ABC-type transport system involved in multi-copper enzyme maturation permease subunit